MIKETADKAFDADSYEAVIGLEIHAELATKTKMFCRCRNDPFHSPPNANICPVCLGLPGALPVANQAAVEGTIMVGLALNCQLAGQSKWDRKNYFYPDLPKGYQISQYDQPLCYHGLLTIGGQPIQITRIHLEEDTGTLQHPSNTDYSLINYNRSGVPLLELVTEPDIRSGRQARLFAEEYQRLLRNLNIATADMEKGEMRVEANISVRTKVQVAKGQFGTKVEVKNLNSFRSTERAINYEINRQIEALAAGQKIVQETRGWHDANQVTFSQRIKEEAADYRYFPEPDLAPLELSTEMIENIKVKMPALPDQLRQQYLKLGLTPKEAEVLVGNKALGQYFAEVQGDDLPAKLIANWVINDAADMKVSAPALRELLIKVNTGKLPTHLAKTVLAVIKATGQSATEIIETEGLQPADETELEATIDKVLTDHPNEVAAYKGGKEQIFGFFVGQVMKSTQGKANPQKINELLHEKLKS